MAALAGVWQRLRWRHSRPVLIRIGFRVAPQSTGLESERRLTFEGSGLPASSASFLAALRAFSPLTAAAACAAACAPARAAASAADPVTAWR